MNLKERFRSLLWKLYYKYVFQGRVVEKYSLRDKGGMLLFTVHVVDTGDGVHFAYDIADGIEVASFVFIKEHLNKNLLPYLERLVRNGSSASIYEALVYETETAYAEVQKKFGGTYEKRIQYQDQPSGDQGV